MTRLSAIGLVLLLGASILGTIVFVSTQNRGVLQACPLCQQDVASATYFGLVELDCDGQWDSPVYSGGAGAQCSDELANVNRLPLLDGVIQRKNGEVVVRLTFFMSGGPAQFPVSVTFDRRGLYERTT